MSEPSGPAMPALLSPEVTLARAAERLAAIYRGVFFREAILRYLDESCQLLAATARITAYLPNLAIRFATERLAAVVRSEGAVIAAIPEVLFVCVHVAGRSQMAAALLDDPRRRPRPRHCAHHPRRHRRTGPSTRQRPHKITRHHR